MNEQEKIEIMREIVNILACKKCTVNESEEILRGVELSIRNTSTVRHLN